jgi:hypothetical protein
VRSSPSNASRGAESAVLLRCRSATAVERLSRPSCLLRATASDSISVALTADQWRVARMVSETRLRRQPRSQEGVAQAQPEAGDETDTRLSELVEIGRPRSQLAERPHPLVVVVPTQSVGSLGHTLGCRVRI